MIDVGPGAYIYCFDYNSPTIAAYRSIYYATKSTSNDSKLSNNVVSINAKVPYGTLNSPKNGETPDGSK